MLLLSDRTRMEFLRKGIEPLPMAVSVSCSIHLTQVCEKYLQPIKVETLSCVWRDAVANEAIISQYHKTLFVPPPQDAGNLTDDII